MQIAIRTTGLKRRSLKLPQLTARVEKMMRVMEVPEGSEVSILLCGDTLMQELNRDHRGFDKSTDVLAFALQEAQDFGGQATVLGDIVISIDTARRQAKGEKRSLVAEVTMLLAHGLLHLLGYDHASPEDARTMFARQDILTSATACIRG